MRNIFLAVVRIFFLNCRFAFFKFDPETDGVMLREAGELLLPPLIERSL